MLKKRVRRFPQLQARLLSLSPRAWNEIREEQKVRNQQWVTGPTRDGSVTNSLSLSLISTFSAFLSLKLWQFTPPAAHAYTDVCSTHKSQDPEKRRINPLRTVPIFQSSSHFHFSGVWGPPPAYEIGFTDSRVPCSVSFFQLWGDVRNEDWRRRRTWRRGRNCALVKRKSWLRYSNESYCRPISYAGCVISLHSVTECPQSRWPWPLFIFILESEFLLPQRFNNGKSGIHAT